MSKKKIRRMDSGIDMKCKSCKNLVKNVDQGSVSVMCFKCVARQLNPNTIFEDEVSKEKWRSLIKKIS